MTCRLMHFDLKLAGSAASAMLPQGVRTPVWCSITCLQYLIYMAQEVGRPTGHTWPCSSQLQQLLPLGLAVRGLYTHIWIWLKYDLWE